MEKNDLQYDNCDETGEGDYRKFLRMQTKTMEIGREIFGRVVDIERPIRPHGREKRAKKKKTWSRALLSEKLPAINYLLYRNDGEEIGSQQVFDQVQAI